MYYLFCAVKHTFELPGIFKYLKLISNIVQSNVSPINGLNK